MLKFGYRKQKLGEDIFNKQYKYYQHYQNYPTVSRKVPKKELSGGGLLEQVLGKKGEMIFRGFNLVADMANKFKGERHMPLWKRDDKRFKMANWAGPNTHVLTRLKGGPDINLPITKVDEIAKAHDLRMMTAEDYDDVIRAHDKMINALSNAEANNEDSKLNIKPAKIAIKLLKKGQQMGLVAADKHSNLKGIDQFSEDDQRLILKELEKLQLKGLGDRDIMKVIPKNKTVLYIKEHIIPSIFNTLGLRNIHPNLMHPLVHFIYKLSKKGTRLSIPTLAAKLSNYLLPLMIYSSHITHKDQLEGKGVGEDLSKYAKLLFHPYEGLAVDGVKHLLGTISSGILSLLKKLRGRGVTTYTSKNLKGYGFWDSLKKAFYKVVHSKPVKIISTVVGIAGSIVAPEIAIPAAMIRFLGSHWHNKKYEPSKRKVQAFR